MAAAALGATYWAATTATVLPGPLAGAQSELRRLTGLKPPASQQAAQPGAGQPGTPGRQGAAGGPPQRPPVAVLVERADKRDVPVRIDAIGTVQTQATVNVRSRVESQITEVAFTDGAKVNAGDLLFKLDSRQIEAQIAQAEANIARDKASLRAADADLKRAELLARRDFATEQRIDTQRAVVDGLKASIIGGQAGLDNLNVQRSFYTLSAPISGRIGSAGLKAGNIAKTGDGSPLLATINQISPIYVAFAVPQRFLPELRQAITDNTAEAIATPQGISRTAKGKIGFFDNAVDTQTGTITLRAVFENADELLWPGALCNVQITLRTEPGRVTVAREAVLPGQQGTFVFVVEDNVAKARPVTVDRTVDGRIVVTSGLNGGEVIVIDGGQQLGNGGRVTIRNAPAAAPSAGTTQDGKPASGSAG